MFFSVKFFLIPAIGILTLLKCVAGLSVLPQSTGLVARNEVTGQGLLTSDLDVRDASDDAIFECNEVDLNRRGGRGQTTKEAKANPYKPKSQSVSSAPKHVQLRKPNEQKALPLYTKLRLSGSARGELNKMGLHGKARRQTIKNQVKKAMRTNPTLKGEARTAVIQHVAHKGGSDPKEKNPITASFLDKHGDKIPNTFNEGDYHHVYMNNKGLPRQAKAGWNKNNADIRSQSRRHQVSLNKTRTPRKSSNKGKGKQNPGQNFSKNHNKGFQRKGQ